MRHKVIFIRVEPHEHALISNAAIACDQSINEYAKEVLLEVSRSQIEIAQAEESAKEVRA